jgi:hypothetical protein
VNKDDKEKRVEAAAEALHRHFAYSNKPANPSNQSYRAAKVALDAADKAVPVKTE